MKIEGNKTIGIRTFRNEDSIPFHLAAKESTEHMHEFMPWCHADYSIEESTQWVTSRKAAWDNADEYSFIIYSMANNELLGGVAINQINFSHRIGNIGYWVKKQALNKGTATEAVLLIAGFAFDTLNLNRLEIVTLPNNVASNRVAEKIGAKYEGIMQGRLRLHGEAYDACVYSLVKTHKE